MKDEEVRNSPAPCPALPEIGFQRFPASALSRFREGERGAEFFVLALHCAQSRWLEGLPAQALLMLNRAMSVKLDPIRDAETLKVYPIPYAAFAWVLQYGESIGFLGNPRRHFQHLATRMTPVNRELRIARAWACWALARSIGPDWPADEKQLREETIEEPSLEKIADKLRGAGIEGEYEIWLEVWEQINTNAS